jgi:hypothetical protein
LTQDTKKQSRVSNDTRLFFTSLKNRILFLNTQTMLTFAEKVVLFNKHLHYQGSLPSEFNVINPYLDNPETLVVMEQFYHKYYNDNLTRKFIIGINPSRHGAGVTGVPFTDTKRLASACGIQMHSAHTHEISSVFMYDMIEAYGGPIFSTNNFISIRPFPSRLSEKQNPTIGSMQTITTTSNFLTWSALYAGFLKTAHFHGLSDGGGLCPRKEKCNLSRQDQQGRKVVWKNDHPRPSALYSTI